MSIASRLIVGLPQLWIAAAFSWSSCHAQTIVKCVDGRSVEYKDSACPNAHPVRLIDLRDDTARNTDQSQAKQRAAAEKAELLRLEAARHREEQRLEKSHLRQAILVRARRQRCDALLLRKKWLDEDRRETTSRSNKVFSKKARRLAEKTAIECAD